MVRRREQQGLSFDGLPGADIVAKGLDDLAAGTLSQASLVVNLFSPRLIPLGIAVPEIDVPGGDASLALYKMLGEQHGNDAHSQYNALLRRVISFTSALEREHSAMARGAPNPKPDGASSNS